ncbi:MAG: type VII secretion protein EccC, partial [Chloroflexi bacterium]
MPRVDGRTDALDQQAALEGLVEQAAENWKGPRARPVVVLPPVVPATDLPKSGGTGIPLGLSERDLGAVYVDLRGRDPHFLIFGDGESGKTNALRTILLGLMSSVTPKEAQILVVDYRRTLLGVVEPDFLLGYAGAEPAAAAQ